MNFILHISSKCGQGGGVKKSENFADIIPGSSRRRGRAIYTHGIAGAGFLNVARPVPLCLLIKKGRIARRHLLDGVSVSSGGDVSSTPKLFPMRPLRRRPSSYTGFMAGNICSIRRKLAKLCELRGPERGWLGSKGSLSNLKAQLKLLW